MPCCKGLCMQEILTGWDTLHLSERQVHLLVWRPLCAGAGLHACHETFQMVSCMICGPQAEDGRP